MGSYKNRQTVGSLLPGWPAAIRRLILIVVGSFAIAATAQFFPNQAIQYTDQDGLPSLEIYDILQDRKGYIWLGTEAGLVRFDGYDFKVFTTDDGLPNNDIIAIAEDSKGRIWINSIGPLGYWSDGQFTQVDSSRVNLSALGFDLAENQNGDIWLNNGREVKYYRNEVGFLPLDDSIAYSREFVNDRFALQSPDSIWLHIHGAFYLLEQRGVKRKIVPRIAPRISNESNLLLRYPFLYYATLQGLAVLNLETEQVDLVVSASGAAFRQTLDKEHLILINFYGGVQVYAIREDGSLDLQDEFLEGQFANRSLVDNEGNLWIATFGNGLYFYPARNVDYRDFSPALPVDERKLTCVQSDGERIWVGTQNGSIYELSLESDQGEAECLVPNLTNRKLNRIFDIYQEPGGDMWFVGDDGFFRFDGQDVIQLSRLSVKRMMVNADHEFLLASNSGVLQGFRDKLLTVTSSVTDWLPADRSIIQAVTRNRSYAALRDTEGRLWMDDMANGLTQVDDRDTVYWADQANLFHVQVKDMVEWQDGIVAMATQGGGLVLFRDTSFWVVNTNKGLPSTIVNTLLVDGETLWAGTNAGLAALSDLNWEDRTYVLKTVTRSDGLFSDDIEDMALAGHSIALATPRGLFLLDRELSTVWQPGPTIYLTGVQANEEALDFYESQTLSFKQNNLSFHFVGLSYKSLGDLKYRYRLKGIDSKWIYTTALEARYGELPPGQYTFEVYAIGRDGMESAAPVSFNFSVTPHFSMHPLFIVVVFLLLFSLAVLLGYSFRAIRQRRSLQLLVDEKTHALNERLEELAETNQQLKRSNDELEEFARAASHDLKSPLRNVASFVQLLERRAGSKLSPDELEYIEMAVRGTKSMERIINDLLAMSRVGRDSEEDEFLSFASVIDQILEENQAFLEAKNARVVVETGFPLLRFNPTNARQLLQNLIINGITYNDSRQPMVRLGCVHQGKVYQFYVKDNGIGISKEYEDKVFALFQRLHNVQEYPGTGIGLAICKKIVESNQGQIWFESAPGSGTTFYFTLPETIVEGAFVEN